MATEINNFGAERTSTDMFSLSHCSTFNSLMCAWEARRNENFLSQINIFQAQTLFIATSREANKFGDFITARVYFHFEWKEKEHYQ
jgi:hypothetical protein